MFNYPPQTAIFDLEALQATIEAMTDEDVARAVLAIRNKTPHASQSAKKAPREKTPAQARTIKAKTQSKKELLEAARKYMLENQIALPFGDAAQAEDNQVNDFESSEDDVIAVPHVDDERENEV